MKLGCFVTIWIFARLRHIIIICIFLMGFVTIWIFARLRQRGIIAVINVCFVTIWIFAGLKMDIQSYETL